MTQEPQMESLPVDEASQPFVGRWNALVSTTNWEKGRIIGDWREPDVIRISPTPLYNRYADVYGFVRAVEGWRGA